MAKSLIIDAGHGGSDPGAGGFGIREKDWTLKISLYQYNRLKELGARVALTRNRDVGLDSVARTNLIKGKYDYCMSNHWNAYNGVAHGVETIHSVFASSALADRLARAIVDESKLHFRRVFSRKNSKNGDYYFMHRMTGSTTTVIVEYGFIDNKKDNDFYKNEDNFFRVAERVVKEWCAILGVKYVAPKKEGLSVEEVKKLQSQIDRLTKEVARLEKVKAEKTLGNIRPEGYAVEALKWAEQEGITNAERPGDSATRQQVITFLKRYHDKFRK